MVQNKDSRSSQRPQPLLAIGKGGIPCPQALPETFSKAARGRDVLCFLDTELPHGAQEVFHISPVGGLWPRNVREKVFLRGQARRRCLGRLLRLSQRL
jgi:hypothetical protein